MRSLTAGSNIEVTSVKNAYLGGKREESQDGYDEEIDVRDTLELDEQGMRGPREHGVALGTHFIPLLH